MTFTDDALQTKPLPSTYAYMQLLHNDEYSQLPVNVVDESGPGIKTVMKDVPSHFALFYGQDYLKCQREFTLGLAYAGETYYFKVSVSDEFCLQVSPAQLSSSLMTKFYDAAQAQLGPWTLLHLNVFIARWNEIAGSATGYWGNITSLSKKSVDSVQSMSMTAITGDSAPSIVKRNETAGMAPSIASWALPGMKDRVDYPCGCVGDFKPMVYDMVQHLNDHHLWTREEIADWIDKLHNEGTINAEFEPWGELETEN